MKVLRQNGFSAVEVLLVIIAISIIGFGGYYVYSNQKTSDENANANDAVTTKETANDKATRLTEMYEGTAAGKKLSIKYPADWTLKRGDESATGIASMDRIIGPDGDVVIIPSFYAGELAGIGGYCEPEARGTFTSVTKYDIPAATDLYLAVTESAEEGYRDTVMTGEKLARIKEGVSTCELGITDRFLSDDKTGAASLTIQSLSVPSYYADGNKPDMQQVKNYHNSADFKTAIKIVQTLVVE